MSINPVTLDPTVRLAAMIARAERRRERLEELSEVGMALAKEIATRMIDGPYHPEPRNDPGRSFAVVSRAVRLTLALEAKVDERILALCNGDTAALESPSRGSAAKSPRVVAIDQEAANAEDDEPGSRSEGERERLVDYERPDLPEFDAAVDAIRADLGLKPDGVLETTLETPLPRQREGGAHAAARAWEGEGLHPTKVSASPGISLAPHPPDARRRAPPSRWRGRGVPESADPPALE